jgi:hypothetical protein
MFTNPTLVMLIISSLIAAICAYLILTDRKRIQPALSVPKAAPSIPLLKKVESDFPQLIDRPGFVLSEEAEITYQKEEQPIQAQFEPVDDKETALLKAAEIVVEKVQDVVTHIASDPPNPEEITSKIKAIVNPYALFHGTEYFDAINSFIAITVERDCNVQLTKEQLLALWN